MSTRKYLGLGFGAYSLILFFVIGMGCGKTGDAPGVPRDTTTTNTGTKKCLLTGILQLNSGTKPELSLLARYDSDERLVGFIAYDSVANKLIQQMDFTYVTKDSVIIDAYQYIRLDTSGRVVLFRTVDDLSNPAVSDVYKYIYTYNTDGFLSMKQVFINDDPVPNYTTRYVYQGGLMVSSEVLIESAGNIKFMDAEIRYDNSINTNNFFYVFPDGFELGLISCFLNFGKHPAKLMSRLVTTLYDPGSGTILDKWTTSYSNIVYNANNYLISGQSTGDVQAGVPWFYGKTQFRYTCK